MADKDFEFQVRIKNGNGDSVVFQLSSNAHSMADWSLAKGTACHLHDAGQDEFYNIKYPADFEFFSKDDMHLGTYRVNLEMVPRFDVECIKEPAQAKGE